MSGLPALRAAQSNKERAQLLLTEPLFDLIQDWAGWLIECRRAEFKEGIEYLEAVLADITRKRHGGSPFIKMGSAAIPLLVIAEKS